MIVRVILIDVVGVMVVVLIGRHDAVDVVGAVLVIYVAIFVVIFYNWRCTLYSIEICTPDVNDCYNVVIALSSRRSND